MATFLIKELGIVGLVATLVLLSPAAADEIAIDQVWSLSRIPGTRDIFELERGLSANKRKKLHRLPDADSNKGTLTHEIYMVLELHRRRAYKLGDKSPAKPGFAVSGHGHDALKAAHAVLVKGERPQTKFSKNEPISLVFFTHHCGELRFKRIEQSRHKVTIHYEFFSRFPGIATAGSNIALIPIVASEGGDLFIDIVRVPSTSADNERQITSLAPMKMGSIEMSIMKPFQIKIE
jgi:hypothetical protein